MRTENEPIKSEENGISIMMVLVIGILGFVGAAIGFVVNGTSDIYPDLPGILAGLFFLLLALVLAYLLRAISRYEISDDTITVKYLWGGVKKTILLYDISCWTEIETATRSSKFKTLTLYTNDSKFSISSNWVKNYEKLKPVLIKGKPADPEKLNISWAKSKKIATPFIGAGLIALLLSVPSGMKDQAAPTPEFATVAGVISNQPHVSKSKSSHSVLIQLENYPLFNFNITQRAISLSNARRMVQETHKGDSIWFDITADTYLKKLAQTRPLDFWDKTMNYRDIDLYGIRANGKSYVSITDNDFHRLSDGTVFLIVGGFLLALVGVALFFQKKPQQLEQI